MYRLINCSRFLLPSLHIKMVLEMPTIAERREALQMLPTDLYDSFKGIITRIRSCPTELGIQGGPTQLGIRVLMWLHFARRPLKLVELQHALAVRQSQKEFNADYIPSRKVLLDCCLGLVLVDEETLTVRFTHFTIEEYFRKNSGPEFPNGYSYLAETCLTYLNFGGLRQHCTNLGSLEEKLGEYAFLAYAALNWGTYYRYVERQCSVSLKKLARIILKHESERPLCAIQALYYLELDSWMRFCHTPVKKFSGVHVIAYFGLNEIMVVSCDVELEDDSGRPPLSWAAINGHEPVVRLLIEGDGVDIDAKDDKGRTPLMSAAEWGQEAVVRVLIERGGVDINATNNEGLTALSFAVGGLEIPPKGVEREELEAVVELLNARCDVQARGSDTTTPATSLTEVV